MQRRYACSALLWAVVLGCAAGCGDSLPNKVFPVKGRLMVGDKPAAGAHLAFHAVDRRVVSRPVAVTEPDGSFRLMTYAVDDGAPAGDYVVTIFWRDKSIPVDDCEGQNLIKHDRLYGLYFDSTKSPLRATVCPGPNDITIQAIDPSDSLKNDSLGPGWRGEAHEWNDPQTTTVSPNRGDCMSRADCNLCLPHRLQRNAHSAAVRRVIRSRSNEQV